MADDTGLDLRAYLDHLGLPGTPRVDAATLAAVQRAHLLTIPFENLDAARGTAPSLAIEDVQRKLLGPDRGGYCYEHNTLFAAALEALGFGVTLLAARVVVGAERPADRPRTHMALLVDVPGEPVPYLADTGYGGAGAPLGPLPLAEDDGAAAGRRRHRLVRVPHRGPLDQWVLQAATAGDWEPQYAFTVEPFERPDFAVANWHIATNPRSPFHGTVVAYRLVPGGHLALRGRDLTTTYDDGRTEHRQVAPTALAALLREEFGITLPSDVPLPD